MVRIGIIGAAGRMGRAVADVLEDSTEASLAGGADEGDDVGALARRRAYRSSSAPPGSAQDTRR
jgi:dihydrodipicolinate reductase